MTVERKPRRFKSVEDLSVDEHLKRLNALRRGEPEPRFESDEYRIARRKALVDAGLEPDDDGPPIETDDEPSAEPDDVEYPFSTVEGWLKAIQKDNAERR